MWTLELCCVDFSVESFALVFHLTHSSASLELENSGWREEERQHSSWRGWVKEERGKGRWETRMSVLLKDPGGKLRDTHMWTQKDRSFTTLWPLGLWPFAKGEEEKASKFTHSKGNSGGQSVSVCERSGCGINFHRLLDVKCGKKGRKEHSYNCKLAGTHVWAVVARGAAVLFECSTRHGKEREGTIGSTFVSRVSLASASVWRWLVPWKYWVFSAECEWRKVLVEE